MRTTPRSPLTPSQKLALLEAQDEICPLCTCAIVEGDRAVDEHLRALGLGGSNTFANRAMVHRHCAAAKTGGPDGDQARIASAKRIKRKAFGFKQSRRPLPGGKGDWRKRKVGGGCVDRATGDPL